MYTDKLYRDSINRIVDQFNPADRIDPLEKCVASFDRDMQLALIELGRNTHLNNVDQMEALASAVCHMSELITSICYMQSNGNDSSIKAIAEHMTKTFNELCRVKPEA